MSNVETESPSPPNNRWQEILSGHTVAEERRITGREAHRALVAGAASVSATVIGIGNPTTDFQGVLGDGDKVTGEKFDVAELPEPDSVLRNLPRSPGGGVLNVLKGLSGKSSGWWRNIIRPPLAKKVKTYLVAPAGTKTAFDRNLIAEIEDDVKPAGATPFLTKYPDKPSRKAIKYIDKEGERDLYVTTPLSPDNLEMPELDPDGRNIGYVSCMGGPQNLMSVLGQLEEKGVDRIFVNPGKSDITKENAAEALSRISQLSCNSVELAIHYNALAEQKSIAEGREFTDRDKIKWEDLTLDHARKIQQALRHTEDENGQITDPPVLFWTRGPKGAAAVTDDFAVIMPEIYRTDEEIKNGTIDRTGAGDASCSGNMGVLTVADQKKMSLKELLIYSVYAGAVHSGNVVMVKGANAPLKRRAIKKAKSMKFWIVNFDKNHGTDSLAA